MVIIIDFNNFNGDISDNNRLKDNGFKNRRAGYKMEYC